MRRSELSMAGRFGKIFLGDIRFERSWLESRRENHLSRACAGLADYAKSLMCCRKCFVECGGGKASPNAKSLQKQRLETSE